MQADIVYYKEKKFFKKIINRKMMVGIFLSEKPKLFVIGKKCRFYTPNEFFDNYELCSKHIFYLDYDAYVKVVQGCLYNINAENMIDTQLVYNIMYNALLADKDYRHAKRLSSKEIYGLTPKTLKNYFSSIIKGLNCLNY